MRTNTVAFLSLLSLAALAACSTAAQDDASSTESAQTDDEFARGALRVVGAKLQNEPRSEASC